MRLYKWSITFSTNSYPKIYPNTPIYNVVNDELSIEIKQIMKEVCDKFDIVSIWLENIGKENGHPNQKGMRQIMEQICEGINFYELGD